MSETWHDLKIWIAADWRSHRLRMTAEVTGMLLSLFVALLIASTTPYPPLLLCYILWEIASGMLVYGSILRRSLGLSLLYSGFLMIDFIGLVRTLCS